ncbi:MAG: oligosaccharide flippase family protein [Candidatus Riflebacteria bacterium]|nr:oligosaccharide flippase family protein [Candidatus Riflebacteria bacterium]
MNIYKSFLKNNFLVFCSHFLLNLKSFFLIPILIKTVGETTYGSYALLVSLLGIVFGISAFGVGFRCKRFLPSTENFSERNKLFYPQFYFHLISLSILGLLLYWYFPFLNEKLWAGKLNFRYFLIFPYLFSYLLYAQTTEYFGYSNQMLVYNIGGITFPYLFIILVLLLGFIKIPLTIDLILLAELISAFLVGSVCFWLMLKQIKFSFEFFDLKTLLQDIKLGIPLVVNNLIEMFISSSDRFLLAIFISVSAVGQYLPAYSLGAFIIFFPRICGIALQPLYNKCIDQNEENKGTILLQYSIKVFLLIAIPFIFGGLAMGKDILAIFANEEVAKKSYLIIPLISFGMTFLGLKGILSSVLFVQLRTALILKLNIVIFAINFCINIILLICFKSVITVGIAFGISNILGLILMIKFGQINCLNIRDFLPGIVKSLLCAIFMFAMIKASPGLERKSLDVACRMAIGISSYFLLVIVSGFFSKKEILFVKSQFFPTK